MTFVKEVNSANWVIFVCAVLSPADFFQDKIFRKILSCIPSVSNSLDPDQADLGPNCLQRL